jgi:hypothetical protein
MNPFCATYEISHLKTVVLLISIYLAFEISEGSLTLSFNS